MSEKQSKTQTIRAKTEQNTTENYFQLTPTLFSLFSDNIISLTFYKLNKEYSTLFPFFHKGDKLNDTQKNEVHSLCKAGLLFLATVDLFDEEYLTDNLQLLPCLNFDTKTRHKITVNALSVKYERFYAQPFRENYNKLAHCIKIFVKSIQDDPNLISSFLPYMFTRKYSPGKHAFNSLILGLYIFLNYRDTEHEFEEIENMALGLILHDIGMRKVPDTVLKKEKHYESDRDKIKWHVANGLDAVKRLKQPNHTQKVFQAIQEHHETLDGTGYPRKLKSISEAGRITAIASSAAMMILEKPYEKQFFIKYALGELAKMKDKYDRFMIAILISAYEKSLFRLKKSDGQSEKNCR